MKTARLLGEELGLRYCHEDRNSVTFSSNSISSNSTSTNNKKTTTTSSSNSKNNSKSSSNDSTTTTFGMSFQSRFGYDDWVKPYTDATLQVTLRKLMKFNCFIHFVVWLIEKAWAEEGIESVDVVAPCFAQDCLETLEEITDLLRHVFINAGGKRYRYMYFNVIYCF